MVVICERYEETIIHVCIIGVFIRVFAPRNAFVVLVFGIVYLQYAIEPTSLPYITL